MKKNVIMSFIFVALVLSSTACRTKTKIQEPEAPRPPETTSTQESVPVESPTTDFVREEPEVKVDPLDGDIDEINRRAQLSGWIRDAFFNYNESTLTSEAQEALSTSASWLKAHPEFNLVVEGHCDERGTEEFNLALGDRRSNIARDYLAQLGVDGSRIRTISYGEERPFAQGSSDSAWSQNRRAHLVLVRR